MNRKNSSSLAVGLLLSLLLFTAALAKGPPSKVTITGPGVVKEVEIDDPETLEAFSFFQFEDVNQKIEAPEKPGEGYTVTRFILDRDKLIPWDRAIYYPSQNGAAGVVFFEGLIGPNSTEFDGFWYQASSQGDAAMQQIITGKPVSAEQQPGGINLPALVSPRNLAIILLAVLVLVGAGIGVRRSLRQTA
jgi:hypothetical protein